MKVASFGGGVNSTAMLLGIFERGESVDLILFADTGGEKPETYRHVAEFSAWLEAHGFPPITTVREERFTLEQECIDRKMLPSIVVGLRSCSDKFKIRPQDRFIAKWEPAIDAWDRDERVIKLIGFDAGEPHRISEYPGKRYARRYPLVEWGWARSECIAAIERHGIEVPPKSSCFFCPEMREREVLDLRDQHPDLFARAVKLEENSGLIHIKGLAREYSWKQIANYDEAQLSLLPKRAEKLPCMCYDGE